MRDGGGDKISDNQIENSDIQDITYHKLAGLTVVIWIIGFRTDFRLLNISKLPSLKSLYFNLS